MTAERLLRTQAVFVLVAAFVLLLPALLNGRPFVFPDTEHYYDIGEAAVGGLIGGAEPASAPMPEPGDGAGVPAPAPGETAGNAAATGGGGQLAMLAKSRSFVYSVLAYLSTLVSGFWPILILQAGLAAWLVGRTLSWLAPDMALKWRYALVAALAILTPAGGFVGFVMPDVFAALLVLAALNLLLDPALKWFETLLLMGIIAAGAIMHTTILLLGVTLVLMCGAYKLVRHLPRLFDWSRVIMISGALASAIVVNSAYFTVAESLSGEKLGRPPFLLARVLADGPGTKLLERACAEDPAAYQACVFAGVEFDTQNEFLWSADKGVLTLSIEEQFNLLDEETGFVLDTVASYPLQQFAVSTRNFVEQLGSITMKHLRFGTPFIAASEQWGDIDTLANVSGGAACAANIEACQSRAAPIRLWIWLNLVTTALACLAFTLIAAAWAHARLVAAPDIWKPHDQTLFICATLIVLVVANAGICGVLSGPHDRYQARLIWVLPLFLAVLFPVWRQLPLWKRSVSVVKNGL